MWTRFFLSCGLTTARQLFRDHLSNFFNTPGLLDRVRACLPSDRARLLFDCLAVELALEYQLQIDVAYLDRTLDLSSLVTKGANDGRA